MKILLSVLYNVQLTILGELKEQSKAQCDIEEMAEAAICKGCSEIISRHKVIQIEIEGINKITGVVIIYVECLHDKLKLSL